MTGVIISPHLDDAILSFGGSFFRHKIRLVVTALAGVPPAWTWPTPFDNASGFDDSRAAVLARRAEDELAADVLRARVSHLNYLDGQYGIDRDETRLAADLWRAIRGADYVVVPLGLLHPDHRLVARACRRALMLRPEARIVVYADLPAARLEPSHIPGAVKGWERAGFCLAAYEWPINLEAKRQAWEHYGSQQRFPELAWENLTKERGWLATFCG